MIRPHPIASPDDDATGAAGARQDALTKPPGSLGRLEEIAVRFAGFQGVATPSVARPAITVFAADHGVVAEGVSAFPQAVTVEMLRNFDRGGAAICVLARDAGASLEVVDVGSAVDYGRLSSVRCDRVGWGTVNLAVEAAMTSGQLADAWQRGDQAAERAAEAGADLFVPGEMGIGNTTAAAAVAAALLGVEAGDMTGPGTGLDDAGVGRKTEVVDRALRLHRLEPGDAGEALRCMGGFEIAAIAGACVGAASRRLPVLVDGFIVSVAVLAAVRLQPDLKPWLVFGHASAEPGHRRLLAELEAAPLLDLGMRLGEGSGATAALPLIRLACRLHAEMATFAEAGVSEGL